MNIQRVASRWIAVVAIAVVGMPVASADQKADRAAIAEALTKLATSATALGQTAKASDDRGARKKFAPAATELGDDLAALARRAGKDVPLKTLGKEAAEIEKDANALVELADEAEDKAERKSLRSQAALIGQGIATVKKSIESASTKEDKPAEVAKFTGRLLNNSDSCSWAENVRFVISANGQQVFQSQLVFPGKDLPLVLSKGTYLVQVTDTVGKLLAQGNLAAEREGWSYKSGCVNQD
jgi:Skp family chaperone for outer membrane proteins